MQDRPGQAGEARAGPQGGPRQSMGVYFPRVKSDEGTTTSQGNITMSFPCSENLCVHSGNSPPPLLPRC